MVDDARNRPVWAGFASDKLEATTGFEPVIRVRRVGAHGSGDQRNVHNLPYLRRAAMGHHRRGVGRRHHLGHHGATKIRKIVNVALNVAIIWKITQNFDDFIE